MFMVWPLWQQRTQVCFSQSFLALVMDEFSLPIHVKVLDEDDEETDEEVKVLADRVPFNSLLQCPSQADITKARVALQMSLVLLMHMMNRALKLE